MSCFVSFKCTDFDPECKIAITSSPYVGGLVCKMITSNVEIICKCVAHHHYICCLFCVTCIMMSQQYSPLSYIAKSDTYHRGNNNYY